MTILTRCAGAILAVSSAFFPPSCPPGSPVKRSRCSIRSPCLTASEIGAFWSGLQYLEIVTFLSPYLLSSQGDRVAMAHSVEGRYPFLDYRIVEFSERLPSKFKLRALRDKYLVRKSWVAASCPRSIYDRPKKPYRAPIHRSFFMPPGSRPTSANFYQKGDLRNAGLFHMQRQCLNWWPRLILVTPLVKPTTWL